MSNVVSLASASTDVSMRGAAAKADYGTGATAYYDGNRAALTPDVIANKFQTIFTNCDNYRKIFVPEILESYAQYNGETSQSGKEPWQSDIHVPLPAQAIDVASGRLVEAIFNDEDFFETDPYRYADTPLTEFAQHAVKWQIAKSRGKFDIKMSLKDALICGFGPLKIHFETSIEAFTDTEWVGAEPLPGQVFSSVGDWQFVDSQRVIRKLRFESIIPTDVWLDPTGKNRYIIQRTTRSVSDLWPLCYDQTDPDTGEIIRKAVYDKRQVQRVLPGMRDEQRSLDAARIRRDTPAPYGQTYDQTSDVYELWGDFVDPDNGVTLFRNIVATFVDKRICIRFPQRNPFRHGKVPYIIFQAKLLPHQVYGYGLLQQNRRIESAINRQANVMADKAMLQVPTLEYDASASKDPAIQGGSRPKFSPGKMWPRKPGPDKRIFYPVDGFKEITEFDIAWMDRLTGWYSISSTVPEFEGGTPVDKSRRTKGEMDIRSAAAQQNFNDAAVHIEEQGIGPMLKLAYLTMVQYEDQYDDQDLSRMFGDDDEAQQFIVQLTGMSPAERWRALYLDSEFKAVGITNAVTRDRKLQQTNQFTAIIAADPLMGMFIDKREQLRELLPLYQQNTRMILPQAQALIQMAQMAAIQSMMATLGGGPPQPGAPGGAPPGGPGGAPGANGPPQAALGPAATAKAPPSPGGKPAQGGNPHNSLASVSAQAGRK